MTRRREQRVAVSAFRHHSHSGVYEACDGTTCAVRFVDQHMIALEGEYQEAVFQEDMVQVLCSELPRHDVSKSTLKDMGTGQVYILGREIKDDGYVRTLEVSKR